MWTSKTIEYLILHLMALQLVAHAFLGRGGGQLRRGLNTLSGTPDNKEDSVPIDDDQTTTKMIESIVSAVDQGRESDLREAGLKITTKSASAELVEKLTDPQVSASVLGAFGPEEEQILMAIERNKASDEEIGGIVPPSGLISDALVEELRIDAQQTVSDIRSRGPSLQLYTDCELDSVEASLDILGTGLKKVFDPKKCDILKPELNSELKVRGTDAEKVTMECLVDGAGHKAFVPLEASERATPPSAPTQTPSATASTAVEDGRRGRMEMAEEVAAASVPEAGESHHEGETPGTPSSADGSVTHPIAAAVPSSTPGASAPSSSSASDSDAAKEQAQAIFQQLLKTSMDTGVDAGDVVDCSTKSATVDAVKRGDLDSLDMDAILGEALSTISKNMGIDIKTELKSGQGSEDMQRIVGATMSELAANMKDLDEESAKLYEKLGRLQEDLADSTREFEEKKEYELEQLLAMQGKFQGDFEKSSMQMKTSAEDLAKTLAELEQTGDVMTSLAMFPIKNSVQKGAFVLGLALLFKVPFDALQLFAVRSTDFSDWFTIFTQSALCVAFFSHYGLVRAVFNELSGDAKKSN